MPSAERGCFSILPHRTKTNISRGSKPAAGTTSLLLRRPYSLSSPLITNLAPRKMSCRGGRDAFSAMARDTRETERFLPIALQSCDVGVLRCAHVIALHFYKVGLVLFLLAKRCAVAPFLGCAAPFSKGVKPALPSILF